MEDQCGNVNVCATEFQTRVENVSKRGKRQLGSSVFRSRTFSPVPPGFPALSGSPPMPRPPATASRCLLLRFPLSFPESKPLSRERGSLGTYPAETASRAAGTFARTCVSSAHCPWRAAPSQEGSGPALPSGPAGSTQQPPQDRRVCGHFHPWEGQGNECLRPSHLLALGF